jgi:hypothetical protein
MSATVALLVAVVSVTAQQQKPDFAGKWVVVSPDRNMPRAPTGLFLGGSDFSATQDKQTLTIVRATTSANPSPKFVLNLDGSPSKNVMNIGGQARDTISTAAWSETRLIVITKYTVGERDVEQTQILFLDRSGNLLVEQKTSSKVSQGETSSKWEWTYKRR